MLPITLNLPLESSDSPTQSAPEGRVLFGWVDAWVGGWMGGDQKGPSIFLIFNYVDKQEALISNLASKIAYDNYIKSYEQIMFENLNF